VPTSPQRRCGHSPSGSLTRTVPAKGVPGWPTDWEDVGSGHLATEVPVPRSGTTSERPGMEAPRGTFAVEPGRLADQSLRFRSDGPSGLVRL
jgi:hypothetical protein